MDLRTPFAHASEAEMARILDFYAVRWEYEPHTFPILWNLDGDVVESFSPDFFLPELDLYLEMTTLRQKLVRKKNRKLRRLRELYPSVNIKLFYARDFRALMLKYGKLALVEGLSGTSGQVALPHGVALAVADVPGMRAEDAPDGAVVRAPRRRAGAAGVEAAAIGTGRRPVKRRVADDLGPVAKGRSR
jgi:hypoxanthine phosphoribosyltransferase